jgi:hypothetical protein
MWPWSYNYLCNQCLSPLMLWVRISIRARCTTLCDKVCQWLATGRLFSPGLPVSSTKKWPPRYNWNIIESGVKQQSCKNWWTAWQSCWRSLLIISIISSTITGRSESTFLTFVYYICWMYSHRILSPMGSLDLILWKLILNATEWMTIKLKHLKEIILSGKKPKQYDYIFNTQR